MKLEQQKLLDRFWCELLNLTEVQSLANTLRDKNIFKPDEILEIFANPDERVNNKLFFECLKTKDEYAFHILVDWLRSTEHDALARELAIEKPGVTPYCEPQQATQEDVDKEDEFSNSIETKLSSISFDDSKDPLNIIVELANTFLDTKERNHEIPFYSSRSKNRGHVLILNNYDFSGTDHKERKGAEIDERNLVTLFEQMGGWIIKKEVNKKAAEMESILKSFSQERLKCDICFVIIMSHGSEQLNDTIIYGVDDKYIETAFIHKLFTNEKCDVFCSKPKVFIYQVCRGTEIDLPHKAPRRTQMDGKLKTSIYNQEFHETKVGHIRPVDDMLIGFATMPGSKAHRDPYRGTWYIELLCKSIMELAHREPLDNILIKVDEGLRRRMSERGTVQTSEHTSRGFKKLYLNPGIYEMGGQMVKYEEKRDNLM